MESWNNSSNQQSYPPPPPNSQSFALPWEGTEKYTIQGLYKTWQMVVFKPQQSFGPLPYFDWRVPLAFAAIVMAIQLIATYILGFTGLSVRVGLFWMISVLIVQVGIFLPLLTGLLLLFSRLFGLSTAFAPLFRLVCYSSGAAVFSIIPTIGAFLGLGFSVYILMNGLSRICDVPLGKTIGPVILAVLAPLIFAVIFMFFGLAAIG